MKRWHLQNSQGGCLLTYSTLTVRQVNQLAELTSGFLDSFLRHIYYISHGFFLRPWEGSIHHNEGGGGMHRQSCLHSHMRWTNWNLGWHDPRLRMSRTSRCLLRSGTERCPTWPSGLKTVAKTCPGWFTPCLSYCALSPLARLASLPSSFRDRKIFLLRQKHPEQTTQLFLFYDLTSAVHSRFRVLDP